jgi:hypothetical protein
MLLGRAYLCAFGEHKYDTSILRLLTNKFKIFIPNYYRFERIYRKPVSFSLRTKRNRV